MVPTLARPVPAQVPRTPFSIFLLVRWQERSSPGDYGNEAEQPSTKCNGLHASKELRKYVYLFIYLRLVTVNRV